MMAAKLEWTGSVNTGWQAPGSQPWRIGTRLTVPVPDYFVCGNPDHFPRLADAQAWCQAQEDAASPPAELPAVGDVYEVPGRKETRRFVERVSSMVVTFRVIGSTQCCDLRDWQSWLRESGAVRIDGEGERMRKELVDKWRAADWEIEQILGRALGYPKYADDQKNFPGATGDDVCVGDHVAASLASEAAARVAALEAEVARLRETVTFTKPQPMKDEPAWLRRFVDASGTHSMSDFAARSIASDVRQLYRDRDDARAAVGRLMEALRRIEHYDGPVDASFSDDVIGMRKLAREAIAKEEGVKS